MREVIEKVSGKHRFDLRQLEVMPDHVHCFVGAPPVVSPANIARILKGASSCIFLRENSAFRRGMRGSEHLWNPSYYVGSVGDMSKAVVLKYIERQKQDA
jgi:putative transposase